VNTQFSGSGHEEGEKGECEVRKGEEREIRGDKGGRGDEVGREDEREMEEQGKEEEGGREGDVKRWSGEVGRESRRTEE
jgi:hypothetical protein